MFMGDVNSSSLYYYLVAKEGVEHARESIGKMINAEPSEILFLSGGRGDLIESCKGSESINQALIGGVRALKDSRRTIIASCFEHPAVNETLEYSYRLSLILQIFREGIWIQDCASSCGQICLCRCGPAGSLPQSGCGDGHLYAC